MTEEQAKKQDAKQEPVKEDLTDEELEGVSGGAERDFVPREEKFDDDDSIISPATSTPGTNGYDLTTPFAPDAARASL